MESWYKLAELLTLIGVVFLAGLILSLAHYSKNGRVSVIRQRSPYALGFVFTVVGINRFSVLTDSFHPESILAVSGLVYLIVGAWTVWPYLRRN